MSLSDGDVDKTELKTAMPQISLNAEDLSSLSLPVPSMTYSQRCCRQTSAPSVFKLSPPSPVIEQIFVGSSCCSSTKFALRSIAPHHVKALNYVSLCRCHNRTSRICYVVITNYKKVKYDVEFEPSGTTFVLRFAKIVSCFKIGT
jgi:hypothetical protein